MSSIDFAKEFVAVNHSVNLHELPAKLVFPASLTSKIQFDLAKKKLVFQGFMSKREYDLLVSLSQEVAYQRAIDQLFRTSVIEVKPRLGSSGRLLLLLIGACFILSAFVWWMLLHPTQGRRVPVSRNDAEQTAQKLHSRAK